MKYAFLIIAHNEFEILRLLVSKLDDERNDIYVHIDRKVKMLPELKTRKSSLYIIDDRIDVRWGNYSQIKCEYLLWESAFANGPYDFYHLISGTHMPLKSQDEIHSFFDGFSGKSLFCNLESRHRDYQEILKLHRYNFCTKTYASPNTTVSSISQFVWKSFIAIQRCLNISINNNVNCYWANNWCSLSHDAVAFLIKHKKDVRNRYRWSFCGDEWFAPTELMNSELKDQILSIPYFYNNIGRNNASVIDTSDIPSLLAGDYCFARKFSSKYPDVITSVLCRIKDK